jgi:uncharacterized protein
MLITHKLVLVTGASGGIGAAIAKEMAKAGGRIILLARRQEALDQVAREIRASGGEAWPFSVDLGQADQVENVAGRVMERLGTPDILVNNAGAGRWRFVDETSPAEAVALMAVPYLAAFSVVHAFLPAMLERNTGHITNVSSIGSRFVWPGATGYLAARWAVRGFTEALRADLDGTGISVTLFECGVVNSTYWEHNQGSRERVPKLAKLIPELTPEDVAHAIVTGVQRNKRLIVIPFRMKLTCWLHAIFPRIVQRFMTKTGYRRGA